MDEADKNISILKREVWRFLKSNYWTISSTWISYNMKVTPQLWCSPSKNYLSQAVAAQTWAKKNAAFRWGHAFLMCIPWGIFMLPHSPALLSITRNSAPQLKIPKLSLKQLQSSPDLVGSVRLSSQERSELWETFLSWDVSHRRFVTLSLSPALKTGFMFSSKGFMALWASPPGCGQPVSPSSSSRTCSQDRDKRSGHHPAHLDLPVCAVRAGKGLRRFGLFVFASGVAGDTENSTNAGKHTGKK